MSSLSLNSATELPAFGLTSPSEDDLLLAQAWADFCDKLKAAGAVAFRNNAPRNPVDRASAVRLLARNIGLSLAFEMESKESQHPELMHYFDPMRKQGGDNTDAYYSGATINGTDTYRIHGNRGTAKYFAVTLVERGPTPYGGGVAQTLFGWDMKVEDDGSFEIILSPEPQPGNWMKTTPETFRVTFREFFADWENEQPMKAIIDCLSSSGEPPQLTPAKVSNGLHNSADWLNFSLNYWADMIDLWKARPNEFLAYGELEKNQIDFTPGGTPFITYWQLPEDEALIVRVHPPAARFWAVEFGNYWWETMDYRYRLTNTNMHYAQLEDDGELIMVIAHQDPGLPNWLDPSGHSEGYVTFRWIGADSYPRPVATQVKLAELFEHLPAKVKRIAPEGRREQLVSRRRGVINRFGS